jgi:FkbM family methyltransferase
MIEIEIFGKKNNMPDGVILERDLQTQFPIQSYDEMWIKFIRKNNVVLDMGAYVGLISLHFAALGAKVYAFEGSKRNSERLKKVIKYFPQYEIFLHEVALSDKYEYCRTRFNDCVDREHPEQEIQYVKYDEYSKENKIPDPDFVKIDIEGMETLALKCMKRLIHDVRPVWQIECHVGIPFKYQGYPGHISTDEGGFDFEEFEKAGYVIFDKHKNKTRAKEMICFENYFFVPMKSL